MQHEGENITYKYDLHHPEKCIGRSCFNCAHSRFCVHKKGTLHSGECQRLHRNKKGEFIENIPIIFDDWCNYWEENTCSYHKNICIYKGENESTNNI